MIYWLIVMTLLLATEIVVRTFKDNPDEATYFKILAIIWGFIIVITPFVWAIIKLWEIK